MPITVWRGNMEQCSLSIGSGNPSFRRDVPSYISRYHRDSELKGKMRGFVDYDPEVPYMGSAVIYVVMPTVPQWFGAALYSLCKILESYPTCQLEVQVAAGYERFLAGLPRLRIVQHRTPTTNYYRDYNLHQSVAAPGGAPLFSAVKNVSEMLLESIGMFDIDYTGPAFTPNGSAIAGQTVNVEGDRCAGAHTDYAAITNGVKTLILLHSDVVVPNDDALDPLREELLDLVKGDRNVITVERYDADEMVVGDLMADVGRVICIGHSDICFLAATLGIPTVLVMPVAATLNRQFQYHDFDNVTILKSMSRPADEMAMLLDAWIDGAPLPADVNKTDRPPVVMNRKARKTPVKSGDRPDIAPSVAEYKAEMGESDGTDTRIAD